MVHASKRSKANISAYSKENKKPLAITDKGVN